MDLNGNVLASLVYRDGAVKETGGDRKHNNSTATFRSFSEDPSSQNRIVPEITSGDDLTVLSPVLKAPQVRKASFSLLINKSGNFSPFVSFIFKIKGASHALCNYSKCIVL